MLARVVIVFVVIAVLAGLLFYSQTRVEPLKVSGIVEADEIRLGSRVGGRVLKVHVEEGATVEANKPLVELEPFDWNDKLVEADAKLKGLEEQLGRLKAGNRPEEVQQAEARYLQLAEQVKKLKAGPRDEEKKVAKAQLELADARLVRAEQNFRRVSNLFAQKSGAVSEDDMERATEELKSAKALREARNQESALLENGSRVEDVAVAEQMASEAQLAWTLAKKGPRDEDIRQAEAARDAAKAARDAIQRQKDELIIRAPGAGVVEALDLQPGDLVSPNAPVLTLVDHQRMWVRAYVPQNHLNLQLEQKVEVEVDSYPGKKFPGTVIFISQQGEFTPSNVQTPEERSKQVFRIKVLLDPTVRDRLRPGMAADVLLGDHVHPPANSKPAADTAPSAAPKTE